ncbi:MAG TPA: FAD-dependent oxidoreductase [Parafilimonas sp.]|nr:FAD-dependent oxidoreductase [Parafilimonas sp.]
MAHSQLMQRLLALTKLAHHSKKKKVSVAEFHEEQVYNRRKFLQTSGMAAMAATVLAGCTKMVKSPGSGNGSIQPKIAIVGAGIAGLNAAYTLKKQGVSSTLYEANTRVGGRIFTAQNILNADLSTELGGEFIDSDHTDMRNLAAEFGFPLINLYAHSELKLKQNLYYFNGVSYSDDDFINGISPYLSKINNDYDKLSDIIKYNSYSAVDKKFDNMNLEEYLDSINLHGWLRELLLVAYLGEYGLNTWECNAINFLFLFGVSPEGDVALYGSSDERFKISGGNQKIVDALASELKDNINTEHKLVKLQKKGTVYELFFENVSQPVQADIVLLTLPFTILRNVELNVELPKVKRDAINNLGYGNNSKLFLGFNGRPWRTKFNCVGMSYSDNGTQNTWDNSQLQNGNNGGLTVFLGGDDAVALQNGSVKSQAENYLNRLNQLYPGIKDDYNNKAFRMDWNSYPYARCGYSAWKVGQYTTIAGSESETVGNLYFAGEHTSYNYQGYMNGGAATGRRAAENILKKLD